MRDIALALLFGLLTFALGWLMGAGEGIDLIRQQAVDEGFAVREGDGFRWRTTEELERRAARRKRGENSFQHGYGID